MDALGDLRGKRVLVRSDLNVPLDLDGATARITDDGRIQASLPTWQRLLDAGARVIVLAHLGRPKGTPDPRYSLAPVAERMGELLGRDVRFVAGPHEDPEDADLVLLENIRFDPRETAKDPAERGALADELAALADVYVDDAFGAVHRAHASVDDVARRLPHAAGDLVRRELEVLHALTEEPARPYVVVLGGSKVSDKLAVIEHLLPTVDRMLIGGGMCFTFLAAAGYGVGDSLLEPDQVDACRRLLASGKIVLPVDIVVAAEVDAAAETRVVPADGIPAGDKGLDIGPASVERFAAELAGARTVFWNGPMGVFEVAPFAAGTKGVAEAIATLGAAGGGALTVVGGGDSAAAVRLLEVGEDRFGHISTGGGASLEYLEGRELPGLAALAG
ncbi:MAG TPA: phosphoglycerate kinase [Mycobacteriales bacterium]|nr:phosphoglycerate kinase [Mycobacteriales bacterium]